MRDAPALLILDMINEIVHPKGLYASHGYAAEVEKRQVLERTADAIDRARSARIPVIYVVVGFSPEYHEWPAGSAVFAEARPGRKLVVGTWATTVHEELKPAADEPIVVKRRISPFCGTELSLLLRARGIDTLLLAGVSTDLVVLSTARDGHDQDYRVEVLADATASMTTALHESALALAARTASVTTVDEALPR
ncbi:cysteine hydrolase [Frankia sp. AiPs1]|uniref:cysteine hydrolase family protein n=1 Tax=Frankia sp. AiPs1 TaxID=573493 RepID=UPI002043D7E9|nr:isochorismatase family cysteine hydrolase [Frankia sp. AiPs1]MCM3920528.1 cysteine hydrolase [Frankia sp. AiPs1]